MLVERIKINFNVSSQFHLRSVLSPISTGREQVHCVSLQNNYPVSYCVTNWLERVKENNSIRAVPAILSSSKRPPIADIFQGKGITSVSLNLSSQEGPLSDGVCNETVFDPNIIFPLNTKYGICMLLELNQQ